MVRLFNRFPLLKASRVGFRLDARWYLAGVPGPRLLLPGLAARGLARLRREGRLRAACARGSRRRAGAFRGCPVGAWGRCFVLMNVREFS